MAIFALALGVVLTRYSASTPVPPASHARQPTPEYSRTEEQLDQKIPDLTFDGWAFYHTIADLGKQAHIKFHIDEHSLRAHDLSSSAPVTLRLHDIKVRTILRKCLDQAGTMKNNLDYVIASDGHIEIVASADIARFAYKRVYDISEFLPDNADREKVKADYIKLFTDTVAPDTWDIAGGWATLRCDGTRLTVFQTERNHHQFADTFQELREVNEAARLSDKLTGQKR